MNPATCVNADQTEFKILDLSQCKSPGSIGPDSICLKPLLLFNNIPFCRIEHEKRTLSPISWETSCICNREKRKSCQKIHAMLFASTKQEEMRSVSS